MVGPSRFCNLLKEHKLQLFRSTLQNTTSRNLHTLLRRQSAHRTILNCDINNKILEEKSFNATNKRNFHMSLAVLSTESVVDVTNKVAGGVIDSSSAAIVETAQNVLSSGLVEPSLSSLGLGSSYTPVGIIQQLFEFAHVTLGLPWWSAIVCGTVLLRALVFPLLIKTQVNAEKLKRVQPELLKLQERMKDASNLQNPAVSAAVTMEMQELFRKHNCHPIKSMLSPLVQMPLFISFFLSLRGMSYLPVESMKTGGLLWFTDLTIQDPYLALPILASASMLLTIETGADSSLAGNPNAKMMKNVFRGICLAMVPLTYTFPAAIFNYWVTSNVITLGQSLFLKQKAVRRYYGLPETPFVPPVIPGIKEGSWLENFKAGFKNAEETVRLQEFHKKNGLQPKKVGDKYEESFEYKPRVLQNEQLFKKASRK